MSIVRAQPVLRSLDRRDAGRLLGRRGLRLAILACFLISQSAVSGVGFSPAELASRRADLEGERAHIEAVVEAAGGYAEWNRRLAAFHADIKARLQKAEQAGRRYLEGPGGSIFTTDLTRFAMADDLENTGGESGAPNVRSTSAFKAITGLTGQLAQRDIHLIFVPIPQKEEVYPHSLSTAAPDDVPLYPQRYRYMEALLDAGVEVVDLLPALLVEKARADMPLYPDTDLHWGNRAMGVAAAEIARRLERYAFVRAYEPRAYRAEPYRLEAQGPLVKYFVPEAEWGRFPPLVEEGLRILLPGGQPYAYDAIPDGPVLLIGDSFMMRARTGGSWAARLAYESGVRVTGHMENQKGAQSAARILARKGAPFYGKRRVIIWYTVGGMLSRGWSATQLPV